MDLLRSTGESDGRDRPRSDEGRGETPDPPVQRAELGTRPPRDRAAPLLCEGRRLRGRPRPDRFLRSCAGDPLRVHAHLVPQAAATIHVLLRQRGGDRPGEAVRPRGLDPGAPPLRPRSERAPDPPSDMAPGAPPRTTVCVLLREKSRPRTTMKFSRTKTL